MTITVTKDVFCDGEGCIGWTFGAVGDAPSNREAREIALNHERYGQFRRDGYIVDLCWDCQSAHEKAITRKKVAKLRTLIAEHEAASGITRVPISEVGR